jgi:uncharacterized membrane protein
LTLEGGLLVSAIAFVGMHFLLSHPLRMPLVRALGEGPFRGIYSLVAIISFALMVYFYRAIGREPPLWDSGAAGWVIGTFLMWLASILFVGSFIKNPALVGARRPSGGPAGVMRITRHPMGRCCSSRRPGCIRSVQDSGAGLAKGAKAPR